MRRALFLALVWFAFIGLFGAIHVSNSVPSDIGEILLHEGDLLIASAQNGTLALYDVSDLMNPVQISSIPAIAEYHRVALEGDLLYVLDCPEQIFVVDIGYPSAPEIVQTIDIGSHSSDVIIEFFGVLNSRLAYIYRIYQGDEYRTRWLCWDLADIEQPSLTTFFETTNDDPRSIQLYNDRAYVLYSTVITVQDITQPDWALESTITLGYSTLDMCIREEILYTVTSEMLSTYQLTSTGSIALLDQIEVTGRTIHWEDNSVLLQGPAHYNDPCDLIDVRDPAALEFVGRITLPRNLCVIDGDFLYIEIDGYWVQFDFSSPENIGIIGEIEGLAHVSNHIAKFDIVDQYLFSLVYGSLNVHDISDIGSHHLIECVSLYGDTPQYEIDGNYLFISDCLDGVNSLAIHDISDLSDFLRIATYHAEVFDTIKDIEVRGDYVYYTHDNNLSIIFINTIEDPLLHTEMPIAGPNDHMRIVNDFLYMWDEDNGLIIYTLENLVVPEFITSIQPGTIRDVAFFESGFAIIGDTWAQLYDNSDPEAPILMSTIEPVDGSSFETGLFDGTRLLLADNRCYRIFIYDVTNLQNPELTHTYEWNRPTTQMQIIDDCLYATNGDPSISIIDLQMIDNDPQDVPKPDFNLTNYPNPFNPTTTILMNLPEEGHAGLTIYNIKGQKVRTLLDDWAQAGERRISWDGKDDDGAAQPSGVYLYRMRCNDVDTCRKMILIK